MSAPAKKKVGRPRKNPIVEDVIEEKPAEVYRGRKHDKHIIPLRVVKKEFPIPSAVSGAYIMKEFHKLPLDSREAIRDHLERYQEQNAPEEFSIPAIQHIGKFFVYRMYIEPLLQASLMIDKRTDEVMDLKEKLPGHALKYKDLEDKLERPKNVVFGKGILQSDMVVGQGADKTPMGGSLKTPMGGKNLAGVIEKIAKPSPMAKSTTKSKAKGFGIMQSPVVIASEKSSFAR